MDRNLDFLWLERISQSPHVPIALQEKIFNSNNADYVMCLVSRKDLARSLFDKAINHYYYGVRYRMATRDDISFEQYGVLIEDKDNVVSLAAKKSLVGRLSNEIKI